MLLLITLVLCVVMFFWLLKRVWSPVLSKFLRWMVLLWGGLLLMLKFPWPHTLAQDVFVNVYGVAVVGLPVWWIGGWLYRNFMRGYRPNGG